MTGEIQGTAVRVRQLATDLRQLTGQLDQQVAGVGTDLGDTLKELRGAATYVARGRRGRLEQMLGELEEPVDDFAATGLCNSRQLIGETRLLVAALSRITKEFERDFSAS